MGPAWHPSYDTPNRNDSCPITHDCSECTSKPGCGFMTNLRVCLSGNHAGPNKMSLRLSFKAVTNRKAINMYWTFGSCPATPCSTYKSCGSCLADKYCWLVCKLGEMLRRLGRKTTVKRHLRRWVVLIQLVGL